MIDMPRGARMVTVLNRPALAQTGAWRKRCAGTARRMEL